MATGLQECKDNELLLNTDLWEYLRDKQPAKVGHILGKVKVHQHGNGNTTLIEFTGSKIACQIGKGDLQSVVADMKQEIATVDINLDNSQLSRLDITRNMAAVQGSFRQFYLREVDSTLHLTGPRSGIGKATTEINKRLKISGPAKGDSGKVILPDFKLQLGALMQRGPRTEARAASPQPEVSPQTEDKHTPIGSMLNQMTDIKGRLEALLLRGPLPSTSSSEEATRPDESDDSDNTEDSDGGYDAYDEMENVYEDLDDCVDRQMAFGFPFEDIRAHNDSIQPMPKPAATNLQSPVAHKGEYRL